MAKGQRRSNRESRKPKKTAAEKANSKSPVLAGASQIVSSPIAGTSYKDRYK
jgi:hypothetical protein